MELGTVVGMDDVNVALERGKAVEDAGFDRLGVPDTKPLTFQACYPVMTALLLRTERIVIGPHISNFVTRHWSVHATTARTFQSLAPGRFFLGFGTGDGAVHQVGLASSRLAEVEESMRGLRTMLPSGPPGPPIHMAFSGPKGMEVAGRHADEVTIGTGIDVGALRDLAARARAARAAAGVTTPLKAWVQIMTYLADTPAEVATMRKALAGIAVHHARFSFEASFDGKNVPQEYQAILRERLARYDFAHHGKSGDNPNGRLFDDHPAIRDYLLDRFCLIGTPDQCARRLETVVREAELDGLWLFTGPKGPGKDAAEAAYRTAIETFGFLRAPRG